MRAIKYIVFIVLCCMILAYTGCKKDYTHIDYRRPIASNTITLSGILNTERGDSAANSVYLDLSRGAQTAVQRVSWDLGFYCGVDTFRVIINHSHGATAIAIPGKSMTAVSLTDSTANAVKQVLNTTTGTAGTTDAVSGDLKSYLAGTVIPEIAANASDNKVFMINRGSEVAKVFKDVKVQISRINNGYQITYGLLPDQQFTTVTINKDPSYNFKYLSFNSAVTNVEPAKTLWDIEWGASTYTGSASPVVLQPDFLMINFAGGVTAAQVMVSTKAYKDFTAADLAGITLSGTRDIIGVNWLNLIKSTTGGYSINTDRYYIIKDMQGNIYKLNFFGGGSRGKPIVQYDILKDNEPKNPGE